MKHRGSLAVILFASISSIALSACGPSTPDAPAEQASTTAPAVPVLPQRLTDKWSRSCALCHVDGNGGAPRIGYAEEWTPRIAQGREALLTHTIEGKANMPPLGYCMSCERDDFVALIDFMTGAAP